MVCIFFLKKMEEIATIDLSGEKMEIVGSYHEATVTKTSIERTKDESTAYGGLPKELWAEREAVEKFWVSAEPDQKRLDISGPKVEKGALPLIVNGTYAFAIQCNEEKEEREQEEKDDAKLDLKEREIQQRKRAEENMKTPVDAFLFSNGLSEQKNFIKTNRYELNLLTSQNDADLKREEFKAIEKVDPGLWAPLVKLYAKLERKSSKLPAGQQPPRRIKSEPRPGNSYPIIRFDDMPDSIVPGQAKKENCCYHILACKVPGTNVQKQTASWKIVLSIYCMPNTVPILAANETHLAVLYQPAYSGPAGLVCLALYEIGKYKCAKTTTIRSFCLPQGKGSLNVSLSNSGVFVVSFASAMYVLGPTVGQDILVVTLEMPVSDGQEQDNPLPPRHVRLVTAVKIDDNHLLFGTNQGEGFCIDWLKRKIIAVEHTPAAESILSLAYNNNNMILHTVMGLTVKHQTAAFPVLLYVDRPVGFDVCGSLIFVVTKYGGTKIFKMDARRMMHVFKEVPQPRVAYKQLIAYGAIKAFPEHIVCLYPNGVVRQVTLARNKELKQRAVDEEARMKKKEEMTRKRVTAQNKKYVKHLLMQNVLDGKDDKDNRANDD